MTCLRCGSDSIIPDVRPDAHAYGEADKPQNLVIERKPEKLVFKDLVRVPMTARVCADCGFVELTATDPELLWAAHLERVANGWTG